MCGICGFTTGHNKELLVTMADSLSHRGPDELALHVSTGVSLAARRLSIVDLEHGSQPFFNEDKTIVVMFNGEIYNHIELREELIKNGHSFRSSHADGEVIPHLYEAYGTDWVHHVNGMFAAALWDSRSQELLLFRDRIGKKPLYYSRQKNGVAFASEIKALLKHPEVSNELDWTALYGYFGQKNVAAPYSAYRDVKQIPPGAFLQYRNGTLSLQQYWKPDFSTKEGQSLSEVDAICSLKELLQDAVRIRMRTDVPYGAFLSGGLDSSAVATMMRALANRSFSTFSLGYSDPDSVLPTGKHDDSFFARDMARALSCPHHEHILDAQEFIAELPELLAAFDEPYSGTISTFYLAKLISRHVKVALSGDGADELFGSYLAHRIARPIDNLLKLSARNSSGFEALTDQELQSIVPFDTPEQYEFLSRIASPGITTWRDQLAVFTHSERQLLLSPEILAKTTPSAITDSATELEQSLTATSPLNRSLEFDQRTLLPDQVLTYVDRLSMAHSLEVRCPFLDYRVIEFANKLPDNLKIREDGTCKHILRQSLKGILPDSIVQRPKEGFVQPIYWWMHTTLKEWCLEALTTLPTDVFNSPYLSGLILKFRAGDQAVNAKIWNLICFSYWYNAPDINT